MTTFPRLTEKAFQRQVIDLARLLGYRVAHFRPAMTKHGWRTPVEADGAGFPDLVLCRGRAIIVAELKASRGKLSPDQGKWLECFRDCGVRAFLWRPEDWDALEDVLKNG